MRPILAVVFGLVAAGCHSLPVGETITGPYFTPANVYRSEAKVPIGLRRVAVLPLSLGDAAPGAESSRKLLEETVRFELGKTALFELVPVPEATLNRWTGRPVWSAEDKLPDGFLERLGAEFDCQGVLFGTLTSYRAYPPVVVGWRFKLLDRRNLTAVWSIDEVFDASHPPVANSAQKYYQDQKLVTGPVSDPSSILGSPARFAQYTLAAVFGTLPTR
jgi:hypothetical protein